MGKAEKIGKKVLGVLVVVALLSGCSAARAQSVISVHATGTVMVQPDMVQMVISISKTAPTTRQAQEDVNVRVKDALQILRNADIEDRHISTASLRFSPEYDWNGRRVPLGQRAEQTISFVIQDSPHVNNNVENNNEKVSRIIDRLIEIDGIELHQVNFSVKDSAAFFARSRELAYQKALEKAVQYAELSGLKVVKALNISEEGAPQMFTSNIMRNQANVYSDFELSAGSSSSVVPSGELEISTTIVVSFLTE